MIGKGFLPRAALSALSLLAAVSCNRTADEACRADLPRLESELARAEAAFARPAGGRSPASLKEGWRGDWKEWAHDQLTLAQRAMDALEEDPARLPMRRSLEGVANGLVEIYALAEEGHDDRLPAAVGRVKEELARLRSRACGDPACRGAAEPAPGCASAP